MPYTQEQYQRAKSAVSSGVIPEDKVPIVQQRIAEFESDQARGYKRAPEGPSQPTLGEVDAQFGPSYLANSKSPTADAVRQTGEALTPEKMQARRQQVDWTKKLTTEPTLKNASKLKVFDDPPDYEPPKDLPGMGGLLPKATTSYFEPTPGEFRQVVLANPRVRAALQEQYPDRDIEQIPETDLAASDAFSAYADARWQRALADALRTKTPITRVMFSDKTAPIDPETGERKLNLSGHVSQVMDKTMALGSGALQGATGGLWDLAMSLGGDVNKRRAQVAEMTGDNIEPLDSDLGKDVRDAGRGSRERNPITGTVGTVAGALDPRQLPAKVAGGLGKGLSKIVSPKSLPGRMTASGTVGAATTVLDENMRAAADLAADALDADKSARETALSIVANLPGVNPVTAGAGFGIGAAADLAGAGFGAWQRSMTNSDRLRAPLKHFEESGGQMGPLMGRRVSPEAEGYQARADAARTTPQDLIVDEVADSLATQRLLEQESALRGAQQRTSVAHAKLEGQTVSPQITAERIRTEAESMPAGTPQARAAKKNLLDFADRFASKESLSAADLDGFLQEVDDAAKFGKNTEPVEHWNRAGKHLRDLRDEFRYNEDATVVTGGPSLSYEEAAKATAAATGPDSALSRYSQSATGINGYLWNRYLGKAGVGQRADAEQLKQQLLSEMDQARAAGGGYDGIVHRGARVPPEQLERFFAGEVIEIPAFQSASVKPGVSDEFLSRPGAPNLTPVEMQITQKGGIALDAPGNAGMGEVVVPPGRFRVTHRSKVGDRFVVHLEQLDNPADKGLFTADAEATIAEPGARQVGGVRDKTGQVKAVEDYSAEQLRQSKLKGFHKDMNKRLGLPEELSAEPVLSEPYVSKGVFGPKTPQEIVESIPPKARLNEDQRRAFEGAIRKTSGRDYLKNRRELEGLAERTDDAAAAAGKPGDVKKKLQIVRQLDDRDQLSQALGAAVDSLNSTGYANLGMLKRIGFRAIPTLKSLSGGLPTKPVTPGVSDAAVKRLREFIPEWEALNLRGGKPAKVLGAARDDEQGREGKFSPEEKEFWLKVIEKIVEQQKPQEVAGNQ